MQVDPDKDIAVVETCRKMLQSKEIGYSASIQTHLQAMHAVVHDQAMQKKRRKRPKYNKDGTRKRGTKTPAGAHIEIQRYKKIINMDANEFNSVEDDHPNRKISKMRLKAVVAHLSFQA